MLRGVKKSAFRLVPKLRNHLFDARLRRLKPTLRARRFVEREQPLRHAGVVIQKALLLRLPVLVNVQERAINPQRTENEFGIALCDLAIISAFEHRSGFSKTREQLTVPCRQDFLVAARLHALPASSKKHSSPALHPTQQLLNRH